MSNETQLRDLESPAGVPAPGEITQLLRRSGQGDPQAKAELVELVWQKLHQIASALMRSERGHHTLQPTALVHEAYLDMLGPKMVQGKMHDGSPGEWRDRAQFFSVAAKVMRNTLVDYARARRSEKRGGDLLRVELKDQEAGPGTKFDDLISVDDALEQLAIREPRQCRIVEMKFFGGLTNEEIAELLDVSERTVKREWKFARAWLYSHMKPSGGPTAPANAGVAQASAA